MQFLQTQTLLTGYPRNNKMTFLIEIYLHDSVHINVVLSKWR